MTNRHDDEWVPEVIHHLIDVIYAMVEGYCPVQVNSLLAEPLPGVFWPAGRQVVVDHYRAEPVAQPTGEMVCHHKFSTVNLPKKQIIWFSPNLSKNLLQAYRSHGVYQQACPCSLPGGCQEIPGEVDDDQTAEGRSIICEEGADRHDDGAKGE